MNDRDTVAKVREIVARHPLPDFIVNLDVRLGDIDGDPAMWLVFRMTPGPEYQNAELERRVAEMNALEKAVRPELLETFDDRFPYIRYEPMRAVKAIAG